MNRWVLGQFRMKSRSKQVLLFHEHGQSIRFSQHAYAPARTPDDGRADENHLNRMAGQGGAVAGANRAVDLPPISVALNCDIEQPERFLCRPQHFARQQDGACASSENGFAPGRKRPDGCAHAFVHENFQHGRALAARHDEAVYFVEIMNVFHQPPRCAEPLQHPDVQLKIALKCEDSGSFSGVAHGVYALAAETSFAVSEMFVLASALETGQPFFAASAISWNLASVIPGTSPSDSRWMPVIVKPASVFSNFTAALV